MSSVLVIQSHRLPLPCQWVQACLDSVRTWSARHEFEYLFFDDALFDAVPDFIMEKYQADRIVISDLARLLLLREKHGQGYETVVWLDADFLIFCPDMFILPQAKYAVGREVWIQHDHGKLKAWKKVHNAMLMFRNDNSFLDFYIDTATRMLVENSGTVPPQFIGPKLLTALHNVVQLPVMETAGMLSPAVVHDLLAGGGEALALFRKKSPQPVAGANLCCSSCDRGEVTNNEMIALIDCLTGRGVVI